MIRLKSSILDGLDADAPAPASVRAALQQAVELEHATIPLYLYGLYSLDSSKNGAIAEILESVVVEEMLHMTLACNVLSALGGAPVIDKPDFIPTYPSHLPGSVDSSLCVDLAPFSPDQLETYLSVESPEDPLDISDALAEDDSITIGEFYNRISQSIGQLGDGVFVSPPRHQVGPELMRGAVIVTNVASAQHAIHIIVEQGEGSTTSPDDGDGEPAHYYRFMQIKKGAMLEPSPTSTPPWAYTGASITLDPAGVYPAPTNPAQHPYPPNSTQKFANDNFNYTYTSLLKALHDFFNGDADSSRFNQALGAMMSLKGQAKGMMAGVPNPKLCIGPSFEYQPVNPSP